MSTLRTIIGKDGRVAVDVNLPKGKPCTDSDEELRAILELLGVPFEETEDRPDAPKVPDGVHVGVREKVGER